MRRPDWHRHARDWPNSAASRFVRAAGFEWHVQIAGPETAPCVLLIHGTGAASHSFRGLFRLLQRDFRVVLPDLPGHGFTETPAGARLSLEFMAKALAALLAELDLRATILLGHSAGTAIAIQMALDTNAAPSVILGANSALAPIEGNALFSPMAKILAINPLVPKLFSLHVRFAGSERALLSATRSPIDEEGRRCYGLLMRNSAHASAALAMMAHWDLKQLEARLPRLSTRLILVAAEDDPMVPARVSKRAAALAPHGEYRSVRTGGHLLHEVDPAFFAELVRQAYGLRKTATSA